VRSGKEVLMAVRDEVRDAQRALAALDTAHSRAVARLDHALARRRAVLAEADRQVAVAQAGVEAAIAGMARQLSAELTASVLGLDVAEVRRLAKSCPPARSNGNKGTE
jgi:hypothetical protein